jgi:hypothetical protein
MATRRPHAQTDVERAVERLAEAFDLAPWETLVLLAAARPDLAADGGPRLTVSTALAAGGLAEAGPEARALLDRTSPLVRHGLLQVEDGQPFGARTLRVPDRVLAHLLGSTDLDVNLQPLETALLPMPSPAGERLGRALAAGVRLTYVRETPARSGYAVAAAGMAEADLPAVAFDLRRVGPDVSTYWLAADLAREAALLGVALVVGPVDRLVGRLDALAVLVSARVPVVLVGSVAWDPAWCRHVPLVLDAVRYEADDLALVWDDHLTAGDEPLDAAIAAAVAPLRLTPEQAAGAAVASRLHAAADGADEVGVEHVQAGVRIQGAGRLEQLATHIVPRAGFDDLILPPAELAQVRAIASRARHRALVLDEWHMGGRSLRGRGVAALFAGESGTGKTLSAEVIAHDLGVDLYTIDLSSVVDKYVGETEKNLERVFDEAEGLNAVLLFDEADAIFGKRTGGTDAHDRHANVETAYLLQRMERFDGIAILTTNLRANLDDAFTRRLSVIVNFPGPDPDQRRELWRRHLPAALPQASDLDLDLLAKLFDVSGGVIRNAALTAAFAAADRGDEVGMVDLLLALRDEHSKMSRLFDASGLPKGLAAALDAAG